MYYRPNLPKTCLEYHIFWLHINTIHCVCYRHFYNTRNSITSLIYVPQQQEHCTTLVLMLHINFMFATAGPSLEFNELIKILSISYFSAIFSFLVNTINWYIPLKTITMQFNCCFILYIIFYRKSEASFCERK